MRKTGMAHAAPPAEPHPLISLSSMRMRFETCKESDEMTGELVTIKRDTQLPGRLRETARAAFWPHARG
jgi:hypothetical protein